MGQQQPSALAHKVLKDVWGYDSFRSMQGEVIATVESGESALVLMPTGGGKSLCYQVPALTRPGLTIVISPLVALMKDQVDALRTCGVAARYYNSTLNSEQARSTLSELHNGKLKLLYVSPERATSPSFISRLRELDVSLLAVDEAHCVSQWGHDFRPDYAELNRLTREFPNAPLLALTATADRHTREDIVRVLGLEGKRQFVASFDRPNIRYTVAPKHNHSNQLISFVKQQGDASGIVYCRTRKRVESTAANLVKRGFSAAAYHAGLPERVRSKVQEDFLKDEIAIVVATVAFGMGIDKPDVRFVVHNDMPKNIESYYQETGRAGRDGLKSDALTLFTRADVAQIRWMVEQSGSEEQKRLEGTKLNAMVSYCESMTCRRRVLLNYFGEQPDSDCGNCDVCMNPPELYDATLDAQKFLSCVYRTGQRFGVKHVVEVLAGAKNKSIREHGHDQLSTYGIGKDKPKWHWEGIARQLEHRGYVFRNVAAYGRLEMHASSRAVLKGEQVHLATPQEPETTKGKTSGGRTRAPSVHVELSSHDRPVFEALRKLRRDIAKREELAPYMVFGDKTLRELSTTRPTSADEMLGVNGVGNYKLERFGEEFLEVIRSHG